jgi:hypothetical protein
MSQNDIAQIRVDTYSAGIVGLKHVRDNKEIGKYGITGTPGLIMNGKVKSVGKVPPRAKLKEWLGEAKAGKQE